MTRIIFQDHLKVSVYCLEVVFDHLERGTELPFGVRFVLKRTPVVRMTHCAPNVQPSFDGFSMFLVVSFGSLLEYDLPISV